MTEGTPVEEQLLNGRYRLEEVQGEGGMAIVYRGHDLMLNRPVAVKVLRPQYASNANFLRRFEREAQAAANFAHPNIVNIYDVGTDGEQHYIVMEYIRGPSLKDLIQRQGPFSIEGAIFIIRQVTSALDYAHSHGLVHRDIKPQNILVDRDGNAKVVDFGIAKSSADENLTEVGTGMGTVHYVSPEQAQGDQATPASDLYSTGVVLFEMLTKRLPFEADQPVGVALQHVNEHPPAPSSYNGRIPMQVDAIVLKTLSKNPAGRYRSGLELSTALDNWERRPEQNGGTTTSVRTEPRPQPQPQKQPQRRPVPRPNKRRPGTSVQVSGGQAAGQRRHETGRMPVVAKDPRARRREPAAPNPSRSVPRSNSNDVGCLSWLVGAVILAAIVGLLVLAFRYGPGLFDGPRSSSNNAPVAAAATITPAPQATSPTVQTGQVPYLVDSTEQQAREAIGDAWQLAVEFADSQQPAGIVLGQTPGPGSDYALGETITIQVSSGPQAVQLPDIDGLPASDVISALQALNLQVATVERANNDVPIGDVIAHEPAGPVAQNSTVTLYVSTGTSQIQVPNLYQVARADAVAQLEDLGLIVGDSIGIGCAAIVEVNPGFECASFPAEAVVGTLPAAGNLVEPGSTITVAWFDSEQ